MDAALGLGAVPAAGALAFAFADQALALAAQIRRLAPAVRVVAGGVSQLREVQAGDLVEVQVDQGLPAGRQDITFTMHVVPDL